MKEEGDFGSTFVNLDLLQMGVGYIQDGDLPEERQIPAGDYTFKFIIRPHYRK